MSVPAAFRALADALPDAILLVEAEGRLEWLNQRARELLLGAAEPPVEVSALVTDDARPALRAFLLQAARSSRPAPARLGWQLADAGPMELRAWGFALSGAGESGPRSVCIRLGRADAGLDRFEALNLRLRELKAALSALAASEEQTRIERDRVSVTLYSIGDGVITTDAEGQVERMNPVASRLTGLPESEARGRPIEEVFRVVNQFTRQDQACPVRRSLKTGRTVELAPGSILLAADGREYAVEDSAAPIRGSHGDTPAGAVLVFRDVTAQRATHQQMLFLSEHDPLTTLQNRSSFEGHLALALERARRDVGQYALVHFDLDQFMLVNDTYGHRVGDSLLIDFAGFLRGLLSTGDIAGRLGGDEFALLVGYRSGESKSLIDRIEAGLQRLAEQAFSVEGQTYRLRASAGLTLLDESVGTHEEALKQADIACHLAKQAGRGRLRVYQHCDASAATSLSEMKMVHEIREAMAGDRMFLVYQPVVHIEGGDADYHEALLRIRLADGSLADTQLMIRAAERYDLVEEIDRWVLQRVLDDLAADATGALPRAGINLSGSTVSQPGFAAFLLAGCEARGVNPGRLCLEITETAAVVQIDHVIELIRELGSHGCEFALDDFGTGFSSFSYLKFLPVQYLKIDGGFVHGMLDHALDRAIVESIASIGGALGLRIVAECVETPAQIEALQALGIGFGQGWAYARPAPLATIAAATTPP
ncbi:MAG: EAL domain-containing protein [Aquimonas sp.]|nr:EAL domain-containing protein [Aquimonas sp.]